MKNSGPLLNIEYPQAVFMNVKEDDNTISYELSSMRDSVLNCNPLFCIFISCR